jgi:hypothetical protein
MKKFFLVILLCILAAGSFTSCKKCVTCEATGPAGAYVTQDYCGNKKQVDDWEATWNNTYSYYSGWTTNCHNQ